MKLNLTNTYKKYPAYQDSGVEWVDKIPADWKTMKIQWLFIKTKRTDHEDEELLSVYRDYGVIPKTSRVDNFNKESDDLSSYQLVEVGDLAINKMKAWQGSLAISEYRGIVSPAYYVYRPIAEFNRKFLHYLLRSDLYIEQYKSNSGGVRNNQWDLDHDQFRKIEALLPPKEEQEKIARFLDEQVERIDTTITKKQRLIELLKEKRTATINHAVTKGLDPNAELVDSGIDWIGKIPKSWRVEKIKYLAPLGTKKTSIDTVTSTYIALENAEGKTGRYLPSAEEVNPDSVVSVFDEQDVLFSKLRPYLAKVLAPGFDGYATGEFLVLQPGDKVLQGYLRYRLLSQDFITVVNDSTYGAQMPRASWNFIGSQFITVPTLEEQKLIVKFLDDAIDKYQSVIDDVQKSITLLQELKSSLISHAVTGKIKV